MEVLTRADDELYTKLVRLAGGNSAIVMDVLSAPRAAKSVDLGQVVAEIVRARQALKRSAPSLSK